MGLYGVVIEKSNDDEKTAAILEQADMLSLKFTSPASVEASGHEAIVLKEADAAEDTPDDHDDAVIDRFVAEHGFIKVFGPAWLSTPYAVTFPE